MNGSDIDQTSATTARRIYVNIPPTVSRNGNGAFVPNFVKTSKYSIWTFLPKNIYEQFHGLANFYFLLIIILQAFPQFSQVSIIIPTFPLVVIILATAIKDGIEDLRRHSADNTVNSSPAYRLSNWVNVNSSNPQKYDSIEGKVSLIEKFSGMFKSRSKSENLMDVEKKVAMPKNLELNDYIRKNSILSPIRKSKVLNPQPSVEIRISSVVEGHESDISRESKIRKSLSNHDAWELSQWQDIQVGDFILLRNNERIPGDCVVISTGEPDGMCYIETKNLDGETNLKIKKGIKEFSHIKSPKDCKSLKCLIDVEEPNTNLYSFNGALHYQESIIPLTPNSLLLRGCVLRNTSWLIAVVVYTGKDTKIMLNSGPTPSKRSKIDKQINPLVVLNSVTLIFLSLTCAIGAGLYNQTFTFENASFIGVGSLGFSTGASTAFITFFNCFIVFQNIIPIALYISLEFTKSGQSYLISQDIEMYDEVAEQGVNPKSWNLCDDLGQIEYVFSDKTGTLTSNMMDFKKASIGGIQYGKWVDQTASGADEAQDKEIFSKEAELMIKRLGELFNPKYIDTNPGFVDAQLPLDIAADDEQAKRIKGFFSVLAICHTVLVEKPEDSENENIIFYRAQSPDESALVTAAKNVGFACLHRNQNKVEIDFMGTTRTYTILNILEFTSDRKRMSVIVLRPEGDIVLMCKGADSVIYERLDKNESESLMSITSSHLSQFANQGLRTLCLAYRRISKDDYDIWNTNYIAAQAELVDRESKCNTVADLIERDMTLMGATAIEDKLQEGVPESIAELSKAGIKIWVLTGDKVETAINIGFSCNLLLKSMVLIVIQAESRFETFKQFREALLTFWDEDGQAKNNKEFALVIDGLSLKFALDHPIKQLLLELGCRCKAVLCCRVSPLQKALVVKLVREGLGAMCLAIGDGANDVSMIQEADIGIGISGKEGLQAVMASDYAITQFRYLTKLLLVHGRWAYLRSAELVLNYFYKNITWLLILFWHQFFCGFTAGLPMDYNFSIFFNTVFTVFPTMTVGVFDQDIDASTSLEHPQIYLRGIKQGDFGVERFWIYMAHGAYQSLICYFGVYLMTKENSLGKNGSIVDGSEFSMILACCAILVINIFGTCNWYSWSWINYFSLIASIILWIVYSVSYCSTPGAPPYGLQPHISFFAIILVIVVLSLLPRLIIKYTQRILYPTDTDLLQEIQNSSKTNVPQSNISINFTEKMKHFLVRAGDLHPLRLNPLPKTVTPEIKPQSPINADGFEVVPVEIENIELPEPKDDFVGESSLGKMEKNAALSESMENVKKPFGKVINKSVQKAGLFFKHLLPDKPSNPGMLTKGGSIAYMNGNVVENTGFAFSHDAGMQDVITPIRFELPDIPEEPLPSSGQKRRRFPSFVPDRFRQFSKNLKMMTKSKPSVDSVNVNVTNAIEEYRLSPSTTPPPAALDEMLKDSRKEKRTSFSSFSRQLISKVTVGARSQESLNRPHVRQRPNKSYSIDQAPASLSQEPSSGEVEESDAKRKPKSQPDVNQNLQMVANLLNLLSKDPSSGELEESDAKREPESQPDANQNLQMVANLLSEDPSSGEVEESDAKREPNSQPDANQNLQMVANLLSEDPSSGEVEESDAKREPKSQPDVNQNLQMVANLLNNGFQVEDPNIEDI